MTVVFREEALADLDGIARIHRVIYGTLDRFPLGGRLNRANGTREYAVPGLPYLIIYVPNGDVVDVIAVFHTSRDPSTKRQP